MFLKSSSYGPVRFYLKMLFLKSSEFCVQVDFYPISSAALIPVVVSYNQTPVR